MISSVPNAFLPNPSDKQTRLAHISINIPLAAEMALATLQGAPIPGLAAPSLTLSLSHSPTLEEPVPEKPILPQFAKTATGKYRVQTANAQQAFTWFRHAGPLVTVRVNVDVGYSHFTCVLEFWEASHAITAAKAVKDISESIHEQFTLQTFDPFNLYCAVSCHTVLHSFVLPSF